MKIKISSSIISMLLSFSGYLYAQKLPNMQQTSLRAPNNVKIDGRTSEWNDSYMAFNNKIVLFYTVANDDDNLYVILHSDNSIITSKIIQGGIKITVNSLKRSEKDGVIITYPVIGQNEIRSIYNSMPPALNESANKSDQKIAVKGRDSAMSKANRTNIDKFKLIGVRGIKDITDDFISIYNETGIKVALMAGNSQSLNYELAIPLKYLGINAEKESKIYYNIKVLAKVVLGNVELHPMIIQGGGSPLGPGGVDLRSLGANTDFWGEYTLAKNKNIVGHNEDA